MNKRLLPFLALFISLVSACGGGGGGSGGSMPNGRLALVVVESDGITPIPDARIEVLDDTNAYITSGVTNVDGEAGFSLRPGVYGVRIRAQGFAASPARGVTPLPFTLASRQTLDLELQLDAEANLAADSIIRGNADYPGLLVVAEDSIQQIAVSGMTDSSGNYILFNVLPGNYVVKGLRAGFESTTANQVIDGADDVTVNLDVQVHNSANLSGHLTFLATANGIVDITLVHPLTLESIPGLSARNSGTAYSLDNVPEGDYLAWATFANDGYVMDPDWINKNGGYPAALEITMAASDQTKDFSITDAVELVSPTNVDDEVVPAVVSTLTPTFSWLAYPSTKHYVVEVLDLQGNSIWGGYTFDGGTQDSTFKHTDIGEDLSVVYNFDASATEALQDGKTYLWRVYAFDGVTPPPKVAISSSEQQMGLFKVVLPAP